MNPWKSELDLDTMFTHCSRPRVMFKGEDWTHRWSVGAFWCRCLFMHYAMHCSPVQPVCAISATISAYSRWTALKHWQQIAADGNDDSSAWKRVRIWKCRLYRMPKSRNSILTYLKCSKHWPVMGRGWRWYFDCFRKNGVCRPAWRNCRYVSVLISKQK